jgi:hypothetical protein
MGQRAGGSLTIAAKELLKRASSLRQHNDDPKPFVWTKPADVILATLSRLPVPSV